jgi:nitroreductase
VTFTQPVDALIRQRFSCRTYADQPIEAETRQRLQASMASLQAGPLGTPIRFELVAATEQDNRALKSLGTYGFIKGATGYFVGAADAGPKNLEDYGYGLEYLILQATDLGLGTCWLGGTFTKSAFAKKISAQPEELLPAVASVGYITDPVQARNSQMRRRIGADQRLPWGDLFFGETFGTALTPSDAGEYAQPLEMVRLGPSASNKQPWRVVKAGAAWHFYLRRTPGYRQGLLLKVIKVDDIQRVDLGIAMCNFELAAQQLNLRGHWVVAEPPLPKPNELTEYAVSWVPAA